MIQTKDIYWLAGLLEGEGCFSWSGAVPMLTVKMNDRDVIERAQRILKPIPYRKNGNAIKRYESERLGKTPHWRAQIAGRRAMGWMMTLYPLMGQRRQERIKDLITLWQPEASMERV